MRSLMLRLLMASFTAGSTTHGCTDCTEHRSSRNSSIAGRPQSRGLGTGTSYSPANDSEEDGTTR